MATRFIRILFLVIFAWTTPIAYALEFIVDGKFNSTVTKGYRVQIGDTLAGYPIFANDGDWRIFYSNMGGSTGGFSGRIRLPTIGLERYDENGKWVMAQTLMVNLDQVGYELGGWSGEPCGGEKIIKIIIIRTGSVDRCATSEIKSLKLNGVDTEMLRVAFTETNSQGRIYQAVFDTHFQQLGLTRSEVMDKSSAFNLRLKDWMDKFLTATVKAASFDKLPGAFKDVQTFAEGTRTGRFAINITPPPPNAEELRQENERKATKVASSAYAQSSLPPCQGSDVSRWTNCFGTYTYANGNKYVGEFKDGLYNGQGNYIFTNGNKYVGEFKGNNFNGQGTFTYTDGSKYVGEFNEDYFNGQGVEYSARGSITKQGRWANGKLVQTFAIDAQRFPFNSSLSASAPQAPFPDPGKAERERLITEVEAERKKRQELEQQLASSKERERITAEMDTERRKAQDVEAQLAVQSAPPQTSRRNAHALVIGNAAYPGSGRLDNPVNDANAISQKLRSMGFTVTMVTDANRQRLVQAMAQFRRSAASADLSLLFYSGHGVQIFGTNYILPTDVDQTDTAQATIQGVRLNEVIGNFMPGKTKIVFLDACRDNPLQRTGDRSVTKGLAPISVAEGTLISYATKDGQTSADGVGSKNSPFTQALLEHLSDPQDIGVVLRKVREKVMKATGGKQQPWEYGSLTGGELVLSAIKPK